MAAKSSFRFFIVWYKRSRLADDLSFSTDRGGVSMIGGPRLAVKRIGQLTNDSTLAPWFLSWTPSFLGS